MNEQYKTLLKKRDICKPYLHATSTELARALQKKIIEGDPEWSFVAGVRHGTFYSWEKERENVTLEEFKVTYDPNAHRNNDLFFTHRDCISLNVVRDNKDDTGIEFIKIMIWEGNNFDGHREDQRCSLYLSGPWWTIKTFADQVEDKWVEYTNKQVLREEKKRWELRRLEIGDAILAGTYGVDEEDGEWT